MTIPSTGLAQLPEDILLYFMIRLEVASLMRLRQTCKWIYSCSKAKQLWVNLYHHESITKNRPFAPYWKHIDDLDDTLLERLVLHTLRLEWRMTMRQAPLIIPFYQKRSVTWVHLIHSQWLLVASSDDISSIIALWSVSDLLTHSKSTVIPTPLAEAFLPAPVLNGTVDIRGTTVRFALELRGRIDQIDVLSVVEYDGRPHICRLRTIEHARNLCCLQGYYIGASLFQNVNVPYVLGWRTNLVRALRQYPDEQGGAIAMHMSIAWVAVVRRRVFEVYMLHKGHCALWKTVDLPHLVGSAKFSSAELHESSLRVCITSTRGLFVYDIECNVEEDLFSFDLIWHYKPPQEVGSRPIASRGALGVTGNNVSWIQGDNDNYAYSVSFAMTGITDCTMLQPTVFQWHNKDTPALYSLGVFDFDEARGILVVGNAFGELSILDFSRSDPHHFAKCLVNPIKAAPCSEEELLPRCEIPSYPGAPFPYFCIPEQVESDTWRYWNSCRPTVIPEGWSADFEQSEGYMGWFVTYSGIIASCDTLTWKLENAAHFYGRPIPLLYRPGQYQHDWVISAIGGLLFVFNVQYSDELMLARPGVTLEQLTNAIDSHGPNLIRIDYERSQDILGLRFHLSRGEEMRRHKRNRCVELHVRGGRVGDWYKH